MYLISSLAVAFATVFLLAISGALLNRKNITRTAVIGLLVALIYGLILWFFRWSFAMGVYGPSPLATEIIIGSVIGALLGYFSSEGKGWDESHAPVAGLPGTIIALVYLLYVSVCASIRSSDILYANEKAKLIGEIAIISDSSEALKPSDTAKICLVSEEMAGVKANAALSKLKVTGDIVPGSRYKIGKGTKQYVAGQLWWIFPLEFQGYFKWKEDKQVPGYLRVSAQNPFDDAQAVQENSKGEEIHMKYLRSAAFEYRADRYLRYNGYMGKIIIDWTFEVDDDWNPFYTVSVKKRTTGYTGFALDKVITLDTQTGDIKEYQPNEMPKWIDRGIPIEILDYQLKKWGRYSKAGWWYNLLHNDKSQKPTSGWYLTYSPDGKCQWFSGFTSENTDDSALTGFTLSDARTGKTVFYKASGVTEDIAHNTAASLWSNFKGYEPTELGVYNLYGTLAYVVPIAYANQYKGVSLISIKNVDVNSKGTNLEEAVNNFRASLVKSKARVLAPEGGEVKIVQIMGLIEEVGIPIIQGQEQIFPFRIVGVPKIFQAVYNYSSPKVPFMKAGKSVLISYKMTGEPVVTCESFDIPEIKLLEESPDQTQYDKQRTITTQEMSRIAGSE